MLKGEVDRTKTVGVRAFLQKKSEKSGTSIAQEIFPRLLPLYWTPQGDVPSGGVQNGMIRYITEIR